MNNDIVIGWHFLAKDGTSHNGYRPAPVGEWETVIEDPVLCERGYHGSLRLIEALGYAPGPILQRCEYRGVVHDDDKFVATTRRAIVRADASALLRMFAAYVAEEAMESAKWADERSWAATSAANLYALGLISAADLSAAESAARLAAESAARSAAWSAARLAQNAWLEAAVLDLPDEP